LSKLRIRSTPGLIRGETGYSPFTDSIESAGGSSFDSVAEELAPFKTPLSVIESSCFPRFDLDKLGNIPSIPELNPGVFYDFDAIHARHSIDGNEREYDLALGVRTDSGKGPIQGHTLSAGLFENIEVP
jgi:hypothetical protein